MRQPVTALLCLLSSGCVWRQGALQPKGPKAFEIIELGALFFWISLVVLSLMVLAAVWSFARGARRAESGGVESETPNPEVERRLTRAVTASTVVSLVLLAVLLVASVAT